MKSNWIIDIIANDYEGTLNTYWAAMEGMIDLGPDFPIGTLKNLPEDLEERESACRVIAIIMAVCKAQGGGEISMRTEDLLQADEVFHVLISMDKMVIHGIAEFCPEDRDKEFGFPSLKITDPEKLEQILEERGND